MKTVAKLVIGYRVMVGLY